MAHWNIRAVTLAAGAAAVTAAGLTTATTMATPTSAAPVAHAAAAVKSIGTRKTQDGTLITGAGNRTLYYFRPDKKSTTAHVKQSTCYNACAIVWPPVLATGRPKATGKAKAALIGLIKRKDGTKQVTYSGLPLYYYVKDPKAGEVTGNQITDAFGFWAGLQPSGKQSSSG